MAMTNTLSIAKAFSTAKPQGDVEGAHDKALAHADFPRLAVKHAEVENQESDDET
jgi:hypothetical protein